MLELQPRCLFQTLSLRSLPFSPALLLLVCREKPQTCHRKMPPNPLLLRRLCVVFVKYVFLSRNTWPVAQSQLFLLFSFFLRWRDVVAVECSIACQWRHRGWTERGRPGDEEKRERKKWRDHVSGFLHRGSFRQTDFSKNPVNNSVARQHGTSTRTTPTSPSSATILHVCVPNKKKIHDVKTWRVEGPALVLACQREP